MAQRWPPASITPKTHSPLLCELPAPMTPLNLWPSHVLFPLYGRAGGLGPHLRASEKGGALGVE